jgi:hypothetical protein
MVIALTILVWTYLVYRIAYRIGCRAGAARALILCASEHVQFMAAVRVQRGFLKLGYDQDELEAHLRRTIKF